jgi:hypothetical protein
LHARARRTISEPSMTTTAPSEQRRAAGSSPTVLVGGILLLVLFGAVIPMLLAHTYGALDIPRSDAWSYTRTLFVWRSNGHWDFNNWVSMTLIGQVLLAAPVLLLFGKSVLALNIAFACFGVVGLLGLWYLGRLIGLSTTESLFVALMTAITPIWGPLAPTFMTDVPAFVFEMLALTVACTAMRRKPMSMRLLALSIALGFAGISIRQYGAIPLVAIFVTAGLELRRREDRKRLRQLAWIGLVTVLATVALFAWWRTVPHGKSLGPSVPTSASLKAAYLNAGGFLRLAGLMLAPAILFVRPIAIAKRAFRIDRRLSAIVLAIVTFLLLTAYVPKRPFVGNYFSRRGVLSDDIILPGVRPLLMPNVAFDFLVLIGTLGALLLALAMVPWIHDVVERVRRRQLGLGDPRVLLLGLTLAGFGVGYELAMAVGLPIFDRYALPALPLAALLLFRSTRQRALDEGNMAARAHPSLAIAPLIALALLGLAYTAESASYDGTRWKVAEMAVQNGYSHIQVDGGYEWVGWFRGDGPLTASNENTRKRLRAGYYTGLCVSVLIDAKSMPPDAIASAWSHAPTRRPALFVAVPSGRPCTKRADSNGP